jgi:predicted alpha/beta superfamily hydrolase
MKKSLIRCVLLIIPLLAIFSNAIAQNQPGKRDSLYSASLKEERVFEVVLPENYKPGSAEKYDVLYVLDGDWNLKSAVDVQQFAQNNAYTPPIIMVAVHNTDRSRDMTPTKVVQMPGSGGADKFLAFLKNELVPYINKKYPASGNNILYGHSLGGLFAVYAFVAEPQLFNSYLIVDPSLWWDDNYIQKFAGEKMNASHAGKSLFIAGRDEAGLKQMGITDFDTFLKNRAPKDVKWKIAGYPDEHHGSIRLKSVYDGLKFFYDGYGAPAVVFHPMNGIVLKDKPYKVYYFGSSQVHYTTDGSEPVLTSAKMQFGNDLVNGAKLSAKAMDRTDRFNKSTVGEFKVGSAFPAMAKPDNVAPGGVNYSYYEGEWNELPDFKKMKAVHSGIADKDFDVNKLPRRTNFATLMEGYIEIQKEGYYIFILDSDDGAKLFLGKNLLIDYDGLHGNGKPKTYLVPLEKGFYPVRLEYFQQGGGAQLVLQYVLPGEQQPQPIPFDRQYHRK